MKTYVIKCIDPKSPNYGKYQNGLDSWDILRKAWRFTTKNVLSDNTIVFVPIEITIREIKEDK